MPVTGLSSADANRRFVTDGANELPHNIDHGVWPAIREVLAEPMFRLLLGAGLIYLLLGDLAEAMLLLLFAGFASFITVYQKLRTEHALDALRDLSSPRALVIRDGSQRRIAGREVVRGDLIVLAEGDRVPADGALVEAVYLQTDESLLTGESVPVTKQVAASPANRDAETHVYAGTLIVRGHGMATITATGVHCELGKIGTLLQEVKQPPTPLTLQLRSLVRTVASIGLVLSAGMVLLYGFKYGEWLPGILAGIALAMALLPEEFPVVMTVFLALGARRLAEHQALTRRADTIEALGAATVLCTDKTGTLTVNQMTVVELKPCESAVWRLGTALPPASLELARSARLACAEAPTDPMEQAIHALPVTLGEGARLRHEYPLRPELLAVTQVWEMARTAYWRVAAKGAPEAIARLCHLPEKERAAMQIQVDDMAARGLRVLAVASGHTSTGHRPAAPSEFDLRWIGLLGLADPLRDTVPGAAVQCRQAGIRVVMITGDYPVTARAIALQAGFSADNVNTGEEIDRLTDAELDQLVARMTVCARASPRHKLRIVDALKRCGEIVGMTGDGVNDAPALRAAHIGIAMGARGTDVAREAASIVLLDDDFSTIVTAVRGGRRIYDNLRKALAYIVAIHVPIAGLALVPLLFGWPMLLGPVHIVFMELIVDPVCSVAFEAESEEAAVMRRPPRDSQAPLFHGRLVAWSVIQGCMVLALLLIQFLWLRSHGVTDDQARAQTFLMLVIANIALIFVNRSFSPSLAEAFTRANRVLWPALLIIAALLTAAFGIPIVRELFQFATLELDSLAMVFSGCSCLLVALQMIKRWWGPYVAGAKAAS